MLFKSIAIVVTALLGTSVVAFAQSAAVGTWINEAQAAGGGRDAVTLVINANWTGMFVGGGVKNPLAKIEVEGNTISFTFHPEGTPPAIRMTMRGTVHGDMLTIHTTVRGADGATGGGYPLLVLTRQR